MSQGDVLHNYNDQLKKCIKAMYAKKETITTEIDILEEQQQNVATQLSTLNEQLSAINGSLEEKREYRAKIQKMISQTEAAYMKILESSQTLLIVLKREQNTLGLR